MNVKTQKKGNKKVEKNQVYIHKLSKEFFYTKQNIPQSLTYTKGSLFVVPSK